MFQSITVKIINFINFLILLILFEWDKFFYLGGGGWRAKVFTKLISTLWASLMWTERFWYLNEYLLTKTIFIMEKISLLWSMISVDLIPFNFKQIYHFTCIGIIIFLEIWV